MKAAEHLLRRVPGVRACSVEGRTATVLLDPSADVAAFEEAAAPFIGDLHLTVLGGTHPVVAAARPRPATLVRELAPAAAFVGIAAVIAGVLLGSPTSRLLRPTVPDAVRGEASSVALERVIVRPPTRTVVEAPRGVVSSLQLPPLTSQADMAAARSTASGDAGRLAGAPFATEPGRAAASTPPAPAAAVQPVQPVAPAAPVQSASPAGEPERDDERRPTSDRAKPERDRNRDDGSGTMSATSSSTKKKPGRSGSRPERADAGKVPADPPGNGRSGGRGKGR